MRNPIYHLCDFILNKLRRGKARYIKSKLGYCGENVVFNSVLSCNRPQYIFLHDNTYIDENFIFISSGGNFIMKKNSGAAQGLTVITGTHYREVGKPFRESSSDKLDIIVDEDVWIGANVTLLDGCHIGRGASIGSGSVVRKKIPPYAIVVGNPGKIIGFSFTPEELIQHETALYKEEERISFENYAKTYEKFFNTRYNNVKHFLKL